MISINQFLISFHPFLIYDSDSEYLFDFVILKSMIHIILDNYQSDSLSIEYHQSDSLMFSFLISWLDNRQYMITLIILFEFLNLLLLEMVFTHQ